MARAAIQRKFGIRRPFVLTVGDLQPRKNHLGLLHAFEDVLQAEPKLPHDLVFVGKETWYSRDLHRAVHRSPLRDRVHFAGFVEDADLVQFYGACELFVFPSFYEGFGLPILEAMACGRAVACSRLTAMPEVANAAGILFDPGSKEEIARAMLDILLDTELRVRLERLGLHRAAGFSWEKSAAQTLEVYYDVAGRRPPARCRLGSAGVMKCIFLLYAALLASASGETLHYSINWPSGLSLGEATLRSDRTVESTDSASGWEFELNLDASVPGFAIRDQYRSTANRIFVPGNWKRRPRAALARTKSG